MSSRKLRPAGRNETGQRGSQQGVQRQYSCEVIEVIIRTATPRNLGQLHRDNVYELGLRNFFYSIS
jgi:hypothetical protein